MTTNFAVKNSHIEDDLILVVKTQTHTQPNVISARLKLALTVVMFLAVLIVVAFRTERVLTVLTVLTELVLTELIFLIVIIFRTELALTVL
jgi:hypothetical protein